MDQSFLACHRRGVPFMWLSSTGHFLAPKLLSKSLVRQGGSPFDLPQDRMSFHSALVGRALTVFEADDDGVDAKAANMAAGNCSKSPADACWVESGEGMAKCGVAGPDGKFHM